MQIAAVMDDHNGDLLLASLLNRFNLASWSDLTIENETIPAEKYEQQHQLGDTFLSLLLALVCERYSVGVGGFESLFIVNIL